jgi:hypothetical protein
MMYFTLTNSETAIKLAKMKRSDEIARAQRWREAREARHSRTVEDARRSSASTEPSHLRQTLAALRGVLAMARRPA